ncbi:azlC family protein [Bordetella holmesii 70147]|nr:azlC family protein [Bordetella holmesii 70147]
MPAGTQAGLRACVPVMIGYFPVAVAFGIAASGVGLAPYQVILISTLVYAGASQFLLLASIKAGTPWIWVVALCSVLNARHLLYGPILARLLPPSLRTRLRLAFLLTDEVFATALHQLAEVSPAQRGRWMAALGLAAWLTWIAGTAVGVYAGDGLEQHYPVLSRVMRFALPALFLALVCQTAKRGLLRPLLAGFGVSALLTAGGFGTLGILLGALAGCLCFRKEKA